MLGPKNTAVDVADILIAGLMNGSISLASEPGLITCDQPIKLYRVRAGDTLSAIAMKFYGNANEYPKILQANQDTLAKSAVLHDGDELVIP